MLIPATDNLTLGGLLPVIILSALITTALSTTATLLRTTGVLIQRSKIRMLVQLRITTATQLLITAVRKLTIVLLTIPLIVHRVLITTAIRNSSTHGYGHRQTIIHQHPRIIADIVVPLLRQAIIITKVPIQVIIHLLTAGITVQRVTAHQTAIPAIHAAVLHRATAVAETAEATAVLHPAAAIAATVGHQVEVQEGK